MQSAVTSFF